MKRLLLSALLVLVLATSVLAVGTATVSKIETIQVLEQKQRVVLTISWTDDTAGTTLAINPATYGIVGWYLVQAETDPGSPAPTTLYDIVLVSASGVADLACGALLNLSATATARVSISNNTLTYPYMLDIFTFTLSGNSEAGATGTLKLIFSAN